MPGPPERDAQPDPLGSLEERLGHRFSRRPLLEQALTHRSRAHEAGGGGVDNERLEFLGDAVLDLVVAELLMARHPDALEGFLSRARASVVNKQALAARARAIGLDRLVRLGRGEGRSAGREKASILANVFESVLGALYLDGGLAPVQSFVGREFEAALECSNASEPDPKTRLQEALQAQGEPVPSYWTTAATGPDHAKEFLVEVRCGDRRLGQGRGRSKREAEQAAATQALAGLAG